MIPTDTPWSGLEAGKVDTRRVSASARWNWFWAVMPRADVALVLQLSNLPKPAPDLPKLRNLEIRFQTLPGGANANVSRPRTCRSSKSAHPCRAGFPQTCRPDMPSMRSGA